MIIIQSPPPPPVYQIFMPIVNTPHHYICDVDYCDYIFKKTFNRWEITDEGIYNHMSLKSVITLDGVMYARIDSYQSWKYPEGLDNNIIIYTFLDDTYFFTEYEMIK